MTVALKIALHMPPRPAATDPKRTSVTGEIMMSASIIWFAMLSCFSIQVSAKGANFQVGDGHAAQGNGEVDQTAIETSLNGTLQFIVRKDMKLTWPRAETPTHIITMGTDRNLTEATKSALREMLYYLETEKGLPVIDAYPLMSIAVDLSITQLVDGRKRPFPRKRPHL